MNTNQFNYFVRPDNDPRVEYSNEHLTGFTAWDGGKVNDYSLIDLFSGTQGYKNVCSNTATRSGLDYVTKRQTMFDLDGDSVHIYYPLSFDATDDTDMSLVVADFLSKLHFNYEVGYQEETCQTKLAMLNTWGAWGECVEKNDVLQAVDYGKGIHERTRGCSYTADVGGVSEVVNFVFGSGKWAPEDENLWKTVTGVDFNELDCHCQGDTTQSKPCVKPCKYEQWSSWITWDIADTDDIATRRTASKQCVKTSTKTRDTNFPDFYDFLKVYTNRANINIAIGTYDGSSFCSSNSDGELGFKECSSN